MPTAKRPRDVYQQCTREQMLEFIRHKRLKVIDFRNPRPEEHMIYGINCIYQCPAGYTWKGDDPRYIVEAPRT